jgi:hypothetical protein
MTRNRRQYRTTSCWALAALALTLVFMPAAEGAWYCQDGRLCPTCPHAPCPRHHAQVGRRGCRPAASVATDGCQRCCRYLEHRAPANLRGDGPRTLGMGELATSVTVPFIGVAAVGSPATHPGRRIRRIRRPFAAVLAPRAPPAV